MASFYLDVSPDTKVSDISKKLSAFKTLYGPATAAAMGKAMETDKGPIFAFSNRGVDVVAVGKRYITVKCEGAVCRIDMKQRNHGIERLLFLTDN